MKSWISVAGEPQRDSLLVHALCCSTLQRLWAARRRYSWLSRDDLGTLKALQKVIGPRTAAIGRTDVRAAAVANDHVELHKRIEQYDINAIVKQKTKKFETELQDVVSFYSSDERWTPLCPQLINEVAHLGFALD